MTQAGLQLTEEPDTYLSHPAHFLYLEKRGPFQRTAPKAWRELHAITERHFDKEQMTGMLGLSRIDESAEGDDKFVYQAGVTLKAKPASVPGGLQYRHLSSGHYARFLLTGSYAQLPAAYPRAFSILEKCKIRLREDFCIERYLNSPADTPEDELKTEILIPIA